MLHSLLSRTSPATCYTYTDESSEIFHAGPDVSFNKVPIPFICFLFANKMYCFFDSSSCCMWKQRSLAAPTMLCHFVPHSPPPRRSMWTEPSCQMGPSSPPSPPSSLGLNWNAVQVHLQNEVWYCARVGVQQEIEECRDNINNDVKSLWCLFRWVPFALAVQSGGDGEETHHPVRWQRQPQRQQWVLERKARSCFT